MGPIHRDDVSEQILEAGEIKSRRRRLGAAANALRLGVALIEIAPGARPNPPHAHADEEEQFFVLAGSGLSYQGHGAKARTFEVRAGDFLHHPAGGDAHTLVAGPDGMTVLVVAEGSRSNITYLPRAKQFWLGSRWVPAAAPPPFKADAELGPLELPDPSSRPDTIANLDELELHEGTIGQATYATRELVERGTGRLVLAHDTLPPGSHNTERHFHSVREEAWYVLSGSGTARLGDEGFDLREGSFWLRRPNGGVGHRIEVGPDGMELLTMGDLLPGDVCVYPDRRVARVANGVELPY